MTTLIPKYDQGSTGAINRPINLKLQEIFSVKDFGATGDGTTDDTAAILAAIAAAQAAVVSGTYGGGAALGTAPTVFFPNGVYKVTSALTPDTAQAVEFLNFVGESQSTIVASAGITVFGGIGYETNFKGLTITGGAVAISIKTNNVDHSVININQCIFNEQTTNCIQTDTNSPSTLLNIEQCKFLLFTSTGTVLYLNTADGCNFDNNWVEINSNVGFYIGSNVIFNITNMLGVPLTNMNTTGYWIKNYGSIRAKNCRFGGEGGGCPIIHNYNDLQLTQTFPWIDGWIIIEDCVLSTGFGRSDAGIIAAYQGLPSIIRITGCNENVDSFVINDQMAGGLLNWFNYYTAGTITYPTLSIHIYNNNFRNSQLGSSVALSNKLAQYTLYEASPNLFLQNLNTAYGLSVFTSGLSGSSYIYDLPIYYATPLIGYQNSAIYDVHFSGNPNAPGDASYAAPVYGCLIVSTDYIGSAIVQTIHYQDIFKPTNSIGTMTITPYFNVSGTTSTTIPNGTTTSNIRLLISGQNTSNSGPYSLKITKRL
jgi:hypothetical protein